MSWQSLADVFAYIPTQDDLTSADILVLHTIAHHADQHGEGAYPSLSTIARYTHLARRTIQYALRHLEGTKHILEAVLQPGRYGRQTYRLLLPHVDITKGASDAPLPEEKGAPPAPLAHSKGAPDAHKGAPDAPRSGFKIREEEKPCAHAPEEEGKTKGQEVHPQRPDDCLDRLHLDDGMRRNLHIQAQQKLTAQGVRCWYQIKPVVDAVMVELLEQRQGNGDQAGGTDIEGLGVEEDQAHAACVG